MRNIIQILCDNAKVDVKDARKSAKEIVLAKDSTAICKMTKEWAGKTSEKYMKNSNSFIVAPRDTEIVDIFDPQIYGFGKTKDYAWEAAAYFLLTGNNL